MKFYNRSRPHSALGGKTPAVVYWQRNETVQRVRHWGVDPRFLLTENPVWTKRKPGAGVVQW